MDYSRDSTVDSIEDESEILWDDVSLPKKALLQLKGMPDLEVERTSLEYHEFDEVDEDGLVSKFDTSETYPLTTVAYGVDDREYRLVDVAGVLHSIDADYPTKPSRVKYLVALIAVGSVAVWALHSGIVTL